MKLKKVIATMCCVIMVGTLLTGCSNKTATETTEKTTDTTAQTTTDTTSEEGTAAKDISGTITVWEHGTNFEGALQAVIKGFQAQYPNVEVEYEIKDGDTYYSLLSTAIQSGEAPDVFWTNGAATSNMADFVSNGALLDLTDVVDYSAINKDSLYLGQVGEGMYSVPWMTFDTRCCYYNKDIFEKEGWTIPKTFSEFETLLSKEKEAGYIPISLCPNSSWNILFAYEPILSAMDPTYTKGLADYSVKATDAPAAAALNKMVEWAEKGYFGDNYLGATDGSAQTLQFTTGEAVMNIDGSWNATSFTDNNPDLNLGAFQIPAEDGTTGMVGSFANGFSVYNKSQNMDAAKAFVQYCATLEAQTTWVQTLAAVSGSPDIESTSNIAKEIADCDTTYISWQSVLSNYAKEGQSATTIWEEDAQKVFTGGITADELMAELSVMMQ
jgi:raffinose/stachyose/melibiose transport system substrate-binding protein